MTMIPALCTDLYLPSFPAVSLAFGVRITSLQLTFTSFSLGAGVGQLFYGPVSDRFGRRKPALWGMVLFIAASLLCATATNLSQLVLYRFIEGLGAAAGMVISRAVVRDRLSGAEMAKMLSAMSLIFILSPTVAPSLGALILRWSLWPAIFNWLAVFGLVVLIGTLGIKESLSEERRNRAGFREILRSYIQVCSNHEFRSAALIAIGGSFLTFAYVASSAAVLMDSYHVSRDRYGLLFALISIGLVISNRVNMKFVHTLGIITMLRRFTLVQTLGAVSVLIACLAHAPLWVLLPLIVVCFGCAPGMGGNAMTLGMHPFPEKAGVASALMGLAQLFGSGFIAGALAIIHGDVVIKMGCAMLVGACISFIQVRRIKTAL